MKNFTAQTDEFLEPLLKKDTTVKSVKSIGTETTFLSRNENRRSHLFIASSFLFIGILSLLWIHEKLIYVNPTVFKYTQNWHELESSHSKISSLWSWNTECEEDTADTFPMTFVLSLDKIEQLDTLVKEVSYPGSSEYGKHWSPEKVRNYFKPKQESIDQVTSWLKFHGIKEEEIEKVSKNGGILKAHVTCGQANKMLNTKFGYWTNDKGEKHLRVYDKYFIPKDLKQHLSFISPTLRFPVRRHTLKMEKIENFDGKFGSLLNTKQQTFITPQRIQELYNMNEFNEPTYSDNSKTNRMAVASFLKQYYSNDDLGLFADTFDLSHTETKRLDKQATGNGDESSLDIEYIQTTGNGILTYVFYHDTDSMFVGMAKDIIDNFANAPPYVLSISYGGDEQELGNEFMEACNQYFGQLALMGISVFASSGDSGAESENSRCLNGAYAPAFPASSPFVTSVGGTQFNSENEVVAWKYSGGGFSTYFPRPGWQSHSVKDYFKNNKDELPPKIRYNEKGRGFPDISMMSKDYVVCIKKNFFLVSGTSASAPSIAGMVAKINSHRLSQGKSTLGFLNPLLYSMRNEQNQLPEDQKYFTDIVQGFNLGCKEENRVGFKASEGWNPLTGVGTPNFQNMLKRMAEQ